MEIDAYQLCPCQSGKKIKFCCGKDVLHDLNDILGNYHSGQIKAAIDHLDRTIERAGAKDCLMVLKTHILIGAGELEAAKVVNAEFRKNAPDHTMGLQHLAMLDIAEGELSVAVDSLQNAIDSIKGADIPIALANVYRILGIALTEAMKPAAGLAHLRFARALRSDDEQDDTQGAIEAVISNTSPLLAQQFAVQPGPDDQPWSKLYSNVSRAIARGQFRKALQFLTKISNDTEAPPIVLEATAIVKTFLGHDDAAAAWRAYANSEGLADTEVVEAICLAEQLTDQDDGLTKLVTTSFELSDFESASEKLLSSKACFQAQVPPQQSPDSPPPRMAFFLLDKPLPESAEGVTLDQLPVQLAPCMVYGKQTDREARIEASFPLCDKDQIKTALEEVIGQSLTEAGEDTNGYASDQDLLFTKRLQFPKGIERDQYKTMADEFRHQQVIKHWPDIRLDPNQPLSIRDAAKDPEHRMQVYARLMIIADNARGLFLDEDMTKALEQELGLEPLSSLNDKVAEHPRTLRSSVMVSSLNVDQLESEHLFSVVENMLNVGHGGLARKALQTYLKRDDRNLDNEYRNLSLLARITDDIHESCEVFDRAIAQAEADGQRVDAGLAMAGKIDRCLQFGEFELANDTFMKIRGYLDSEHVQYYLTQVMAKYGLLDHSQSLSQMAPDESAMATTAPANLASPVATEPAEAPAKESKLWLPD